MDFEEFPLVKNDFSFSNEIRIDKGDSISNLIATIEKNGIIKLKFQQYSFAEIGQSFNVNFIDEDGWDTRIEGCNLTSINRGCTVGKDIESCICGKAHSLYSKQGILDNNDEVSVFKIIRNMPFNGDIYSTFNNINIPRIIEFRPIEIKNIKLINGINIFLDNANGYFYYRCKYSEINNFDNYIMHMHNLLDLGSGRFVEIPLTYIAQKENYKEIRYKAEQEEWYSGFGIIEMHLPGGLSHYINKCYEPYKRYRALLGLEKIFTYYVLMYNASIPDIKFVLGSVLMEGLKYFFAKNIKKYKPNPHGYFKKTSNETWSFRDLLSQIYTEFGLIKGYDEFVKYRDEIIHTGHLDYPWPDKIEMIKRLHDFISFLLLKILEYDGKFYSYEKQMYINVSSVTF